MTETPNDTRERLIQCFAAVFPDLPAAEIPLASPASVGSWDSVATITLMSLVEEEFKVSVDPQELENLLSFELMLDYVRNEARVS